MDESIMVGCDLHDRTMLLKMAVGRQAPSMRSWSNDRAGRAGMIADLKRRAAAAGASRIVFAYEASGLGFVLHDELLGAGIECYVLAPTGMERSVQHLRRKTDERDAEQILRLLRAWLLAGNRLPSVWVPDLLTRDDRELVRSRLDVANKLCRAKTQVRCLLKRHGIDATMAPAKPWTSTYWDWLNGLSGSEVGLSGRGALSSLLRQIEFTEGERDLLDQQMTDLGALPRYAPVVAAMRREKGVGVLTALVFLTELGDMTRFSNRRQVAAFLGLAPSSKESGDTNDRKGHITHQGPARVRKVLAQAVWAIIRSNPLARGQYDRLVARNPKHKKIAVVAMMRTLAIRLWHAALEAQLAIKAAA